MHETCMFQVYSMHGTSVFQASYRCIPCVVQAHSIHGIEILGIPFVYAPCTHNTTTGILTPLLSPPTHLGISVLVTEVSYNVKTN